MAKEKNSRTRKQITNNKVRDSGSKLIFGNAELCSQFLRNYMDIPLLKNIRAEDIEDVTERYVPMFTEERDSDTVKRIKLPKNNILYFVSLIEHKTKVDYNVSMQMLRYMVCIWEDYEKEMERQKRGISRTKGFRYPPILPIVYYEGNGTWTADLSIQDRILHDEAFELFTPKFSYKLIELNAYSVEELIKKNDELSLLMLINRLQNSSEYRELNLPEDYPKKIVENSTDELVNIIARVSASMLRHLKLSEEEVTEFTEQVKERNMAVLFENFKDDINLAGAIRIAREKAQTEGMAEGRAKGLAEGRAEGEARFMKLTELLLQDGRVDDLTRAIADPAYKEELYRQNKLK